ncbi:unnamed protein product [Moneuplotes crassus]|uniref:Kinesin-like protein n=1 Tax=Euplotes crassus TaxID=5936 RepID=A0AAD1Y4Z9_EUPCR|nr:unnamed protein product [Moneuplotes crassus]
MEANMIVLARLKPRAYEEQDDARLWQVVRDKTIYPTDITKDPRKQPGFGNKHNPDKFSSSQTSERYGLGDPEHKIKTSDTDFHTFDHIYSEDSSTEDIFRDKILDIIKESLNGVNVTIMAYGQTSSGKTYTMQGDFANPGIICLTIRTLFQLLKRWQKKAGPEADYSINVSYLEIYNETVNDLLNENNKDMNIRAGAHEEIAIPGLTCNRVEKEISVFDWLEYGEQIRQIDSTDFNETSSRSHTVFKISLEMSSLDINQNTKIAKSEINLVDLAGSEGVSSGGTKKNAYERANINKSLLALRKIISQNLSAQNKNSDLRRAQVKPLYRDSKLTRILQNSLNGKSLTCIICTINQDSSSKSESLQTLKFGCEAKKIKLNFKVQKQPQFSNTSIQSMEIVKTLEEENKNLKEENEELKLKNQEYMTKMKSRISATPDFKESKKENLYLSGYLQYTQHKLMATTKDLKMTMRNNEGIQQQKKRVEQQLLQKKEECNELAQKYQDLQEAMDRYGTPDSIEPLGLDCNHENTGVPREFLKSLAKEDLIEESGYDCLQQVEEEMSVDNSDEKETDVEGLMKRIKRLEEERDMLRANYKIDNQEMAHIASKYKSDHEAIKDLEDRNLHLSQDLENMSTENHDLKHKLGELTKKLNKAMNHKDSKELFNVREENMRLTKALEIERSENERILKDLELLKNNIIPTDTVEMPPPTSHPSSEEVLHNIIFDCNQQIDQLHSKLTSLRISNSRLKGQLLEQAKKQNSCKTKPHKGRTSKTKDEIYSALKNLQEHLNKSISSIEFQQNEVRACKTAKKMNMKEFKQAIGTPRKDTHSSMRMVNQEQKNLLNYVSNMLSDICKDDSKIAPQEDLNHLYGDIIAMKASLMWMRT